MRVGCARRATPIWPWRAMTPAARRRVMEVQRKSVTATEG
ncbi:DUF1289 domain-containing protein [Kitasatospora sp. RG8]|nr:DUF1289 domain-containing protein [Kitasatospora sp. RG8]